MKLEAGLESFSGKHADLHKDGHQQRPRALGCLQKPDKYSVMESNNWYVRKIGYVRKFWKFMSGFLNSPS